MAILSNGLLGKSRKSIGSVVTYVLNGQHVARTKAESFNDAKSDSQVKQRNAFKKMVHFARRILPVIRKSFANRPQKRSGYSHFLAKNLKNGAIDVATNVVDYSKLAIASGILRGVKITGVTYDKTADTITVNTVDNTDGTTGFAGDRLNIVVYDELSDEVFIKQSVGARSNTSHTVSIPLAEKSTDRNVNVWAYFSTGEPDCNNCDMSEDEWNEFSAIFS